MLHLEELGISNVVTCKAKIEKKKDQLSLLTNLFNNKSGICTKHVHVLVCWQQLTDQFNKIFSCKYFCPKTLPANYIIAKIQRGAGGPDPLKNH